MTSTQAGPTGTGGIAHVARPKMIEVALPLDAINAAAAREKSIRHGHPSTLHLWWARRPLAACRAVLFASLVDDPSSPEYPWGAYDWSDFTGRPWFVIDPVLDDDGRAVPEAALSDQQRRDQERKRLHAFLAKLVEWESSTDDELIGFARSVIRAHTGDNPPPVLDPFCGGGSIPLEAQRLGLEAHASDLNPVAVLITKALIEIPPRFADRPPVGAPAHPTVARKGGKTSRRGANGVAETQASALIPHAWRGAAGLAADVRHYGAWMRTEAEKRIGHLYPKAALPQELGGGEATVIAWLWARTVTCPNPA